MGFSVLIKSGQRGSVETALVIVFMVGMLVAAIAVLPAMNRGDREQLAQLALAGTANQRLYLAKLGSTGTPVLRDAFEMEAEMLGFAKKLGSVATPDGVASAPVCVSLFQVDTSMPGLNCSSLSAANVSLASALAAPQKIDETGAFTGDSAGCDSAELLASIADAFKATCDNSAPYLVGVSFIDLPGIFAPYRITSNPVSGVLAAGGPVTSDLIKGGGGSSSAGSSSSGSVSIE